MKVIITGKPREDALSQLIESLLNHIYENELYEVGLTAPQAKEAVSE